ncbi:MAG: bifunctional folylpolyglutamate synthase/dihydrofolate synthase [Thermomicrobiales bacterium]|nr:bifunctional folylpolyglutamate synthase/dihydrofolate synthase [Thermomicrobiales bacterium]
MKSEAFTDARDDAGQPGSHGDSFAHYQAAVARLEARLNLVGSADRSTGALRIRANRRLERLRAYLAFIGSPEADLPVVHVTGTSGKGSTATGIAALLRSGGLRVGLATSPYLQAATEKLQIDGRLIDGSDVLRELDALEVDERRWLDADRAASPLTYGEIWPALMLRWFARQGVDCAVVEVAAGGRFDPTNVVRPVATVVTTIGPDHLASLGPTLTDVAWHKAGIFKPGALAVTGEPPGPSFAILRDEAARVGAPLLAIDPADAKEGADEPVFHQVNAALALAVVRALHARSLLPMVEPDPAVLIEARLPGRLESMPQDGGPPVLLDGAHNPDKIAALTAELARRRENGEPRPVVLLGVLATKDIRGMVRTLLPEAAAIITTEAGVLGKRPAPAAALANAIRSVGFTGPVAAEPDPMAAMAQARALALAEGRGVLATGSLFLVGRLRATWFPTNEIVRQQTPWPERRPA